MIRREMSDKIDSLSDLRMSPQAEPGRSMAPPPRRKSFSKLRRRLSQTFRFSFNGSLSEFPHSFVIKEEPDRERTNGNGIYLVDFFSQSSCAWSDNSPDLSESQTSNLRQRESTQSVLTHYIV